MILSFTSPDSDKLIGRMKEGISEHDAHCYGLKNGSGNLQKHLFLKHCAVYMDAAKKNNWKMTKSLDAQDRLAVQGGSPGHQLLEFIQFLIHFIVTDAQLSPALSDFYLAYPFSPSLFVLLIAPNYVISAGFSIPASNTSPIATAYVNKLQLNGKGLQEIVR